METQAIQIKNVQQQLVGNVKRCFINTENSYTVCTDFFHYKKDFYNYISVEENKKGNYSLIMGLWLDSLNSFISKMNAGDLDGDDINDIVREISADLR